MPYFNSFLIYYSDYCYVIILIIIINIIFKSQTLLFNDQDNGYVWIEYLNLNYVYMNNLGHFLKIILFKNNNKNRVGLKVLKK